MAMRVFRGGVLTKDIVYLRGLDQLLTYLGGGGDIEPLLIGKLGPDHIGMVKELQWRKVLREAPLRPQISLSVTGFGPFSWASTSMA